MLVTWGMRIQQMVLKKPHQAKKDIYWTTQALQAYDFWATHPTSVTIVWHH